MQTAEHYPKMGDFASVLRTVTPPAYAMLESDAHPDLYGYVYFYSFPKGTLVAAELFGLPADAHVCGFHIHDGDACIDSASDPFASAGGHYNPDNLPHPLHAGDLPPLFVNAGYAWMACYTERCTVPELMGKTVIVHENADDFTTQPSGNSGARIACGVIRITP